MKTLQLVAEIEKLPLNIQTEIVDYLEFLIHKYSFKKTKSQVQKAKTKKGTYKFNWEGALSHLKDKYTSVELQHYISTLR